MRWAVLLAAVLLNAAANVWMKAGMRRVGDIEWNLKFVLKAATNGYLLAGVGCFGLALLAYSAALTKFQLSVAYPIMTSVGFVVVGAASYLWFKEDLGAMRIVGMLVILVGVYLVARDAS